MACKDSFYRKNHRQGHASMKFVCAVIGSVSSIPNYSANILPNYMASMDVHDVGVEGYRTHLV